MRSLYVLTLIAGVFLLSQMNCYRASTHKQRGWLTGTCLGACDYYATCKEIDGDRVSAKVHEACESECDEVFGDAISILAFESLLCEDAIAFVEGPSGRQPGQSLPPP